MRSKLKWPGGFGMYEKDRGMHCVVHCSKEKPEVVVEKVVRNKRKCVTIVKGLDMFGIKLSEASKKLGKKFASGASVVKGPTEKEQIDVQGDIMYDIVEFITDTWPSIHNLAMREHNFCVAMQTILISASEDILFLMEALGYAGFCLLWIPFTKKGNNVMLS
eukprot:Gb_11237 [translate_table: standard]